MAFQGSPIALLSILVLVSASSVTQLLASPTIQASAPAAPGVVNGLPAAASATGVVQLETTQAAAADQVQNNSNNGVTAAAQAAIAANAAAVSAAAAAERASQAALQARQAQLISNQTPPKVPVSQEPVQPIAGIIGQPKEAIATAPTAQSKVLAATSAASSSSSSSSSSS
eukprot:CAMPEP_0206528762 /NCGR_PEP_ID=MMETSP0325_2-20121206/2179_1 /ASSEMBLY_ACC=CAM_ASM_000347 /TAXON_ID=2866 /ORGANISM="Crypthecodinium cohnii, Strain Seligo" /LENGTH=170 /DNA_ID=CAMNT_0054024509 /DNA_START=117 /DNA_END=626 /DNA_ORIENTATION=+